MRKVRLKTFLVLNLVVSIKLSIAQSLTFTGQVISAIDENPIPYAHLAIEGKPIGTISNQDGYFELIVPTEELTDQKLIMSCIGYETLELDNSSSWKKTIRLAPLINELDEVVVKGDKAELSPKKLVETALKKASQTNKDQLFKLDIEQIAHHSGILTKYYFNTGVELSRNLSSSKSSEIVVGDVEYLHDAGALPVTSFILRPEELLIPDLYTHAKLKKAKGKYSFEFTDLTTVGGVEAYEVSVLQHSALINRSAQVKNDYKFYFSTETLDLLTFERKELIRFEQGYNDIHTLEHTIAQYDQSSNDDPLVHISVEFNQFITRYNRSKEKIDIENKRELISGHRSGQYHPSNLSLDTKKYATALDAIQRNTIGQKLYLFIFWDESSNTIYENREALFELLEIYPFNELEIICIGSPTNQRNWKLEASSYPFFAHYFMEDPSDIQKGNENKIQLLKEGEVLISRNGLSDVILKTIRESID